MAGPLHDGTTHGPPARMTPQSNSETLRSLHERYRASTGQIVEIFRAYALRLVATPTDAALIDSLRREVHRLHGTAGSYGFQDASELAGTLESRVAEWATDDTLEAADRAAIVARFARSLEAAFRP
jgi:chemotaxis protein histidine kinase CheA